MKSFVSRTALTLGLLTLLGGCTTTGMDSWFGDGEGNVAQNNHGSYGDIMPPPKASPAIPVQSHPLADATPAPSQAAQPQLQQQAMLTPPPAPAAHPPVKVAILLPLSGKDAELGKAMQNAAQMALFDMSAGDFELMPRDTDASDASAIAAARDAVASGAQLMIGPLFSTQVPGVRAVAEQAGLSILSLSTDTTVAAPGTFVMGFAPGAQVERIVGFAAGQGLHRFAALVPNTPYGALVAEAFKNAVAHVRGSVVDVEKYDPGLQNDDKAIAALATHMSRMDALFLPEGGSELEKIAALLASAGFDNHAVHVLGTGLWDEPELGHRAPFLIGGWYAATDPAARRNFTSAYTHTYGQEPPRLATLAYDATALAAVLARRGEHFDRAALTNPNGFAGVDGIFRLTADGLVERGLAVDEVALEGGHVVAPAPVTFAASRTY